MFGFLGVRLFSFLGMEEKIHSEVSFTIQHIRNLLSSKKECMMYDADRFLEVPNLNIIWGLVAALRYDFNDPQPKKQFQYLRTFLGEKLAGKSSFWLKNVFIKKCAFAVKNCVLHIFCQL